MKVTNIIQSDSLGKFCLWTTEQKTKTESGFISKYLRNVFFLFVLQNYQTKKLTHDVKSGIVRAAYKEIFV